MQENNLKKNKEKQPNTAELDKIQSSFLNKTNKASKINFSKIKLLLLIQILLSIMLPSTFCSYDYSKHLMKIDEKKFKKAIKRYNYFFLYVDYPDCLQCKQIEPELGSIALTSRLESLKVRFFQINFHENEKFLRNLFDIRTLPHIYFFDNKLNYNFPINLEIDFSYLPRLFKKLSGKFNMTNMQTAEQLNSIHYEKKNMILLFNKEKSEAFELYGKEIRNFVRLSVVAGYDTFYYCDKKLFFEHFIKQKNPAIEFSDKAFFFLTGPIKNVTMQQILEKDSEILFDENKKAPEEEEEEEISNLNKTEQKDSDQSEDEEKNKTELNSNLNSAAAEQENIFAKHYNFFQIELEKLKEFNSEQAKQEFILDYFTYYKYNTYSSLGHAELYDVIELGKPTLIIFGPHNFINEQKNFHKEIYNLSKKYQQKIKFFYSTLDSEYAKYFSRILNLRHWELPVFLIIEKNSKEKNDFNKFKLTNANFTKEAVENFINNYYAKKLQFHFVSQAQLDVTEETLKEALDTLNGTLTNSEMNKKYYNAGRNIYQIEGRHFESFLKDNLNRTVAMLACSFPMINCRNALEKLRFVTQTFNQFLDKLIFVETDPNFNEYVVSVSPNISDYNNKTEETENKEKTKIYKFEDYHRFVFKPLYPQLVVFPAIPQDEIERNLNNLNALIIKKIKSVVDFNEDFDCLKLIRFIGKHAQINPEQVEIDVKYLKEEDVDGNIKFTADYDEDFLSEEELEKDKDLESRIEELKEMLGPEAAELFDVLNAKDSKESKEVKEDILKAVEDLETNKEKEITKQNDDRTNSENTLSNKDDL